MTVRYLSGLDVVSEAVKLSRLQECPILLPNAYTAERCYRRCGSGEKTAHVCIHDEQK